MNHEIITHTPITMDNGNIVEAYVHKLPSGMYALHVEYSFKANANPTRIRQITESIWRNQYRDWFRFIRFQKSSTPLPMPAINPKQ
jgi:hypothetical protein